MRKITISVEDNVYEGLHQFIGQGKISHFINTIIKPYINAQQLDQAYKAMSEDKENEAGALEWIEGLVGDATLENNNPQDDNKWN